MNSEISEKSAQLKTGKWSDEETELLKALHPTELAISIAARLNRHVNSIRNRAVYLKISRKPELPYARKNYSNQLNPVRIYISHCKNLNLKKWVAQAYYKGKLANFQTFESKEVAQHSIKEIPTEILSDGGKVDFETFKKNLYEWTGKKLKKGRGRGRAIQRENGIRLNDKGQVMMKTEAGRWVSKHLKIWEDANGKIPKGFYLKFKDGNKLNCALNNLELISVSDFLYEQQFKDCPKEFASVIPVFIALKKTIKAKEDPWSVYPDAIPPKFGEPYSDKEIEIIKNLYLSHSYNRIAEILGRPLPAVKHKARKLGLSKITRIDRNNSNQEVKNHG